MYNNTSIRNLELESVLQNASVELVLPFLLQLNKENTKLLLGFKIWKRADNDLINEFFVANSVVVSLPYKDPFNKLSEHFVLIQKQIDLAIKEEHQPELKMLNFHEGNKSFIVCAYEVLPDYLMIFAAGAESEHESLEFYDILKETSSKIASRFSISVIQKVFGQIYLYESVFNNFSDALLVFDNKFKVHYANPKAFEIFEISREEILKTSFQELTKDFKVDNLPFSGLLENGFNELETIFLDVVSEKQNIVKTSFEISLLKAGEDFIIARIKDVTSQKKKLNLLIEEKLKAEENDRLKTAFLANMSHEIRTPLNSIIGFSDLLLDDDSDWNERRQFVQMIKSAGGTLLQLIDDIIDISKIEAGQIKISMTDVNINNLLDELLLTFSNEKIKRNKEHVKLSLKKTNKEKGFILRTDPYRFKQILTNLLSNALKFVDDGFVEFGYTGIEPGFVQFFVRDSGIGIQRDKLHLVFQRFGQIDNTAKRNHEGTGLGLSITKQLVELLGGKIWFDSEFSKGTTFYFTLPVSRDAQIFRGEYKPFIDASFNWSEKVFLIVDDVEANFLFYKAILKHTGALLLWAKNGIEAVKICRNNNSVNLVLMDLQMPQLSGFDATKQIKAFKPQLPIIAQTAFADIEGRGAAISAGCDDYITKPVNQAELISLIQTMLNT
jgi:signal transduction histidine kinase/CheY-like chemotaxis protein